MKDKFVLNKNFCCRGFQHSIEAAGQRGISIIVANSLGNTRFLIQSRGIDFENIEKIRLNPNAADIKINICNETGLQFCPWCGRRLQELIDASPSAFEQLALEHKKYHSEP